MYVYLFYIKSIETKKRQLSATKTHRDAITHEILFT
jgi:hypothetical protein